MEWTGGKLKCWLNGIPSFHFCLMPSKHTIIIKLSALMSLVVWWVAPPSEWVARMTRRPCAKSCADSSGPSTVVLAAAHDRLPELAYFVTTAGPMCIAFVFLTFLLSSSAVTIKKTAKASSSESSDAMFLVWDSCVSCVHKLDQVSRASFYEFLGRRTWIVCHGLNVYKKEATLQRKCR